MLKHNEMKDIVFEIIKNYASEDHPINQNEIIRIAGENPDYKCERRTVGRALKLLKEKYALDEDGEWPDPHIHLHYYTIARGKSPIVKGYYFTFHYEDDDEFTDDELMFLMDAVQFSKHVDQKYAEEITGKLAKLSHNRFGNVFALHTTINEKNVPIKKDFFLINGDINTAITQQKMISFYVNKFGVDKKLHHVSDTPVEVCPFRIVVSDGYYYLLCSARNSNVIKSYRLDLLDGVTILDETFVHNAARKHAALHPNEYLIEHRYMSSGETVNVTLTIDSSILGDVIDSFGTKIKIDESDDSCNRLTVHLKSCEKDIIEWAMRYGEYAVITDPEYLRNEITERANRISSYYRDENPDISYFEAIESAERLRRLMLFDVDLNGRESYKNLQGIDCITLRHNGIKDFSFLANYPRLRELSIANNEIADPTVISELNNLVVLNLSMTGITDLEFLRCHERLARLTVCEYSLENIDAIYSLPHLRMLTVNKPVARLINKARLKRTYGESFKYSVEDRSYVVPFLATPLPRERGFDWSREPEASILRELSHREVTSRAVRDRLCNLIYAGKRYSGGSGKLFEIIGDSCDNAERTRLFEDIGHYKGKAYSWYVTYEGTTEDDLSKIDLRKIYAISIFEKNHGRKLVALARQVPKAREPRLLTGYFAHIQYLIDDEIGWAELSGDIEKSFSRVCTRQNLIDPACLIEHNVFTDIEIDGDDYHYYRKDSSGKKTVKKICYGHVELG